MIGSSSIDSDWKQHKTIVEQITWSKQDQTLVAGTRSDGYGRDKKQSTSDFCHPCAKVLIMSFGKNVMLLSFCFLKNC